MAKRHCLAETSAAQSIQQPRYAARRLVVKIGSALLVDEDGEIRRAWLDALADDVARCRARGQEVILVSSGAIAVGRRHLGLRRPAAAARGEAGRRGDRADPPRARLPGGAGPARHHRRADPADPGRYRGAAPASERARDLCAAAGARRGAGRQRERHDRHRRDPLWRQRSAGRTRRADDQRRHAGAAVRHRRALHRRPAQ